LVVFFLISNIIAPITFSQL